MLSDWVKGLRIFFQSPTLLRSASTLNNTTKTNVEIWVPSTGIAGRRPNHVPWSQIDEGSHTYPDFLLGFKPKLQGKVQHMIQITICYTGDQSYSPAAFPKPDSAPGVPQHPRDQYCSDHQRMHIGSFGLCRPCEPVPTYVQHPIEKTDLWHL